LRIFVAGATGVLGRPTVKSLVEAGHEVRGAARSAANSQLLRDLGAEPVTVDLFDASSVSEAISSSDAVINLATKIPPLMQIRRQSAWKENDRLRRDASRVLAEAAREQGAGAYIQESITFMYADGDDDWLTEESPLDVSWISLRSMLEAEKATKEFGEGGGRAINLRFGAFYAPYARSTVDTANLARRRMFPVAGRGDNYFSSIHVDDAASAIVASLGLLSGTYNVVDDEPLTAKEYAIAVAKAIGAPKPWTAPKWLFKLIVGRGPASYILRSQRVSNVRFKQATSWAPAYPNARDGWRVVAAQL
jgi:nucleoside-diphosphate-sugar epimerase